RRFGSTAARPEAARAPLGLVETVDHDEVGLLHLLDHELGDAVATLTAERFAGVQVDEEHLQLVAVAAVDQPGSVEAGHAVAERETAARLPEARRSRR